MITHTGLSPPSGQQSGFAQETFSLPDGAQYEFHKREKEFRIWDLQLSHLNHSIMEFMIEQIPTWSLCYFINDDASGLTEEEIALADKWWTENKVQYVTPVSENEGECHPYFTYFPAFGFATEVIDCNVMILK